MSSRYALSSFNNSSNSSDYIDEHQDNESSTEAAQDQEQKYEDSFLNDNYGAKRPAEPKKSFFDKFFDKVKDFLDKAE